MDIFFATIIGCILGTAVGLLPGFGISIGLLLLIPLLMNQSLIFCIIVYCAATTTSQYFGSVTALSLRIPGENTSFPILEAIKDKKSSNDLYFLTSWGSFAASILSFVLLGILYLTVIETTFYLQTWITLACGIIGFILCILFTDNKIAVSMILFIFGWCVGKIGYDISTNSNFLTFNNIYLYGGIPNISVLIGLYAVPNLIKLFKYNNLSIYIDDNCFRPSVKILKMYTPTILISSFIGFICGLIPFLGNTVSSFISYSLDKLLPKNTYKSNIVASETANNSANISVLIPLLFLGVAIVPSEFIFLDILASGYHVLSFAVIKENILSLFLSLLAVNFFAFVCSWKMVYSLAKIIMHYQKIIACIISILLIGTIAYMGETYNQMLYYFAVLVIFTCVGLCFARWNFIPFIYAFLLQSNLESIIYRFIKLYF